MKLAQDLLSKKIGVLMGGTSREREVSLRSGKNILTSLVKQGFKAYPYDLNIDFFEAFKKKEIEVVFIALHGNPGEDGSVQGFLEVMGVPYTGSGVLASALTIDKVAAKKIFISEKLPTPGFLEVNPRANLKEQLENIISKFGLPLVVKPVTEGSSIGVTINSEKSALLRALEKGLQEFGRIFVEQFIKGREVTVGIIGCGLEAQALPILELVPKAEFYDFGAKYTPGKTEFVIPANLSEKTSQKVSQVALKAFHALGCHGVARIDIIVKDSIPYLLDVNTIPGMTDLSDLPVQAKAAGVSYDQLVLEILKSALIPKN